MDLKGLEQCEASLEMSKRGQHKAVALDDKWLSNSLKPTSIRAMLTMISFDPHGGGRYGNAVAA